VTDPRTQATRTQMDTGGIGRAAPSGWIAFAGILMLMIGIFNVIWGLIAIIDDTRITVGAAGLTLWDVTAWGWIHLILGIVLFLTGGGLLAGRGWARWLGLLFVMLNAFGQIAWMTTYPLWAVLIITLDIVIIYQLTVRWEE
jgi:magnesium-transporting ATPase (P-type)